MNIQPILSLFTRGLLDDMRLMRLHLGRMVTLIAIFVLISMTYSNSSYGTAPGLYLMATMFYCNLVFIIMAGSTYFATSISEEKEEQTLGLLRMTRLNPIAILLGKSTTRLIGFLLLLFAQLPFAMLAITLGGVGFDQIISAFIVLAAFLFMCANLGLLFSVMMPRSITASSWFTITILIYLLAPLLLGIFSIAQAPWAQAIFSFYNQHILPLNPFYTGMTIFTTGFSYSILETFQMYAVWANLLIGFASFLIAWLSFEHFARIDTPAGESRPFLKRIIPSRKKKKSNTRESGSRVWGNAMAWKTFAFLTGGVSGFIWRLVVFGCLFGLIFLLNVSFGYRGGIDWDEIAGIMFFIMCYVLVFEFGYYLSRVFRDEIKWNTLSSLMLVPMSTQRMVYGKVLGCMVGMIPTVAVMFVMLLILSTEDRFFRNLGYMFEEPMFWGFMLHVVLFWHVVMFMSLFMKWGSLFGTIIMFFFTYMFVAMGAQDEDPFAAFLFLTAFIGIPFFHIMIGKRVETIACQ